MAANTGKPKKTEGPDLKSQAIEAGELWLSNIKGVAPLTVPKIDATLIAQYAENKYVKEGLYKQERILFEDSLEITAYDRKAGKTDDELTQILVDMCDSPEVDMNDSVRRRWRDVMVWGCSPANMVWGYEEREYRLLKMRLLPPESFNTAGNVPATAVKNRILPGICFNPDTGETEYWQMQSSGSVKQLENIDLLIDPINKNEVGGTPFILPLVPIIRMLGFTWTKKMQEVNIYGSGGLWFLKVTNPTKSDKEYASKILRNISSTDRYQLRGNMDVISIGMAPNGIALDTITELGMQIRQFFSPSDIFEKRADQIIGGSSGPEYKLYMSFIKGTHRWLERSVKNILTNYLIANAYDPLKYEVRVSLPDPEPDESEKYMTLVKTGFETRAMDTKARMEMLVKAGAVMDTSDEAVAAVKEEFASMPEATGQMIQKGALAVEAMKVDKLDPYSLIEQTKAKKFIQKTLGIESGEV